ncbi:MAG: hypothetical protein COV66_15640 [Nitrospinae bacterium CG11_big_fil_rev_8_21_14_0_20_45_15]|nr:MAG: hypothetical protein COV66_15640 [Nitrospinae bacterium CG11_big_fil_rev_8_21_14_0_20_45_15]
MDAFFEKLPYDVLENFKQAYFLLAGLGFGILLIVVYIFTVNTTTSEDIAALDKKKDELQLKLKQYQRTVDKKETISRELILTEGKLRLEKKQLPREEELPGLLKQISSFGSNRDGFNMTLFELQEGKIRDFYKEIPFEITFQGNFGSVMDFFDKMENTLRLIGFSELNLELKNVTQKGSDKSMPVLFTSFTAKTFSYVEGAEDK